MRILICLALAIVFASLAPPPAFSQVTTSTNFQVSGNVTLSLGILSPTFDDLPSPGFVNLTVIVSNCTTGGSTTCFPLAGAAVHANVTSPDFNFTIPFHDRGDGNYTKQFVFYKGGNYTFNITANHSSLGSTSLFRTVSVNGSFLFIPNMTIHENATFLNGSFFSTITFNYFSNATLQMNMSLLGGGSIPAFLLSFFANKTKEMVSISGGTLISPATAGINLTFLNSTTGVALGRLIENDPLFAGTEQEIFLFLNNSAIRTNLTVFSNEPRHFGIVANQTLLVSPRNASLSSVSYSSAGLSFTGTGSGAQEILVYVGDKGEPANITAGSATLTNSNWTYNAAEKAVIFNSTFSTISFQVSWPLPAAPSGGGSSGSSSSGGGGGGGGGGAPPGPFPPIPPTQLPFTLSPDLFNIKLGIGGFTRQFLTIRNGPQRLTFRLENKMKDFLALEEDLFTLEPNAEKSIFLLFFAPEEKEPDTYVGNIAVTAGGSTVNVPVIVNIRPTSALLDTSVKVLDDYKIASPGEKILALIEMFNLGGTPKVADVAITLELHHIETGRRQELQRETLAFHTQLSIIREVELPEGLAPGKYLLILTVEVEGQKITASDSFDIEPPSLQQLSLLEIMMALPFAFTIILILLIFHHFRKEHREKEQKERYLRHIKKYHVDPASLKLFIKEKQRIKQRPRRGRARKMGKLRHRRAGKRRKRR